MSELTLSTVHLPQTGTWQAPESAYQIAQFRRFPHPIDPPSSQVSSNNRCQKKIQVCPVPLLSLNHASAHWLRPYPRWMMWSACGRSLSVLMPGCVYQRQVRYWSWGRLLILYNTLLCQGKHCADCHNCRHNAKFCGQSFVWLMSYPETVRALQTGVGSRVGVLFTGQSFTCDMKDVIYFHQFKMGLISLWWV